jgi:hypothetical protein
LLYDSSFRQKSAFFRKAKGSAFAHASKRAGLCFSVKETLTPPSESINVFQHAGREFTGFSFVKRPGNVKLIGFRQAETENTTLSALPITAAMPGATEGFSLITSFNFFSFHADIKKEQPIFQLPLHSSSDLL